MATPFERFARYYGNLHELRGEFDLLRARCEESPESAEALEKLLLRFGLYANRAANYLSEHIVEMNVANMRKEVNP